jgi:hypothetical protein
MTARTASAALLLICTGLLAGCQDRAGQCDKLAMSIRGVVKKEMAASASVAEGTTQDKEIVRALKRASMAMDRELDDWQLKRPDKGTHPKGAETIKNYAEAIRKIEVGDEGLKGFFKSYVDQVMVLWEFSKERVEPNYHDKAHEIEAKIALEQEKIAIWCTK